MGRKRKEPDENMVNVSMTQDEYNQYKMLRASITPEEHENYMIALANAQAEKQLLEGTAPAPVVTHFLKLGSIDRQQERRIAVENEKLIKAKTSQLESSKTIEELFTSAMDALKGYRGETVVEDEDIQ